MKSHDAQIDRTKRRYLTFLRETKRLSENSLDGVAKAIHCFEPHTKFRVFRRFHIQQAIAFKADLASQRHARTQRAYCTHYLRQPDRLLPAISTGYKSPRAQDSFPH
jgi:hypothetical protein